MIHESEITKTLNSSKRFSCLAQAIAAPLAQRRDYSSLARKIFYILCSVCHQDFPEEESRLVDINLKECNDLDTQGYAICQKCHRETVALLNSLEPEDLPLYISDSNVFIRDYAIKELSKS